MADKQINGLPLGAPAATDEFAIQKTGGGLNYKYTLSDIRTAIRAIAEAHSTVDNTQAISPTPIKVVGFDTADVVSGITMDITGGNAVATIDAGKDGPYRITFSVAIVSPADNVAVDFVLYQNGVATSIEADIDLSNASIDQGSAGFNTFINAVATDTFEMYVQTDVGTGTIEYDSMSFTLQRV